MLSVAQVALVAAERAALPGMVLTVQRTRAAAAAVVVIRVLIFPAATAAQALSLSVIQTRSQQPLQPQAHRRSPFLAALEFINGPHQGA